eukprot:4426072-Lingulodinium_polyedra.AAC.1
MSAPQRGTAREQFRIATCSFAPRRGTVRERARNCSRTTPRCGAKLFANSWVLLGRCTRAA